MASFDFIDASASGYDIVFKNFTYLVKVSLPVWFITSLCYLITMTAGDITLLRFGIIMFPSMLVTGIYCAFLVRFALYNEPVHVWGTPLPLPQSAAPEKIPSPAKGNLDSKTGLQAGAVFYGLISILCYVIVGIIDDAGRNLPEKPSAVDAQAYQSAALTSFIMLLPIIYAFFIGVKYSYGYVAYAMGLTFKDFSKIVKGFFPFLNFSMMFLVCTLPIMTFAIPILNITEFLLKPLPGFFPVAAVFIVSEIMVISNSVVAVAAAYGINELIKNTYGKS